MITKQVKDGKRCWSVFLLHPHGGQSDSISLWSPRKQSRYVLYHTIAFIDINMINLTENQNIGYRPIQCSQRYSDLHFVKTSYI